MNTIKLVFGIIPLLFTVIMVPEIQAPVKKAMTNLNASPQEDGPYVLYKNDKVFVSYVFEKGGIKTTKTDSVVLAERNKLSLTVATDIPGKIFTVRLKDKLQNEKSDIHRLFVADGMYTQSVAYLRSLSCQYQDIQRNNHR